MRKMQFRYDAHIWQIIEEGNEDNLYFHKKTSTSHKIIMNIWIEKMGEGYSYEFLYGGKNVFYKIMIDIVQLNVAFIFCNYVMI